MPKEKPVYVKGLYGLWRAWRQKYEDEDQEEDVRRPAQPAYFKNPVRETKPRKNETRVQQPSVRNEVVETVPSTSAQTGTILDELSGFNASVLQSFEIITRRDKEYSYIKTYIRNSQNHGFRVEVEDIVRVTRPGEDQYNSDPKWNGRFRLMLWHGTKEASIANIIKDGFRKPLPKGQMFGNGIYFADRASKSLRYCFGSGQPTNPPPNSFAYLLLCDVLVGKAYNAKNANNGLYVPPANTRLTFDSVKCTGEFIPDIQEQVEHAGSKWPIGSTIKNTKYPNFAVKYNEYIVYDPDNIKIKYVVKVKIP